MRRQSEKPSQPATVRKIGKQHKCEFPPKNELQIGEIYACSECPRVWEVYSSGGFMVTRQIDINEQYWIPNDEELVTCPKVRVDL